MMRAVTLALVLAMDTSLAFADDDDDDKVPTPTMAKVTAALVDLGCKDPEGVKHEEEGHLRDRRRQVQDGHDGHQARQGLFSHPNLALLVRPDNQV